MRLSDLDRCARAGDGIISRTSSGVDRNAWRRAVAAGSLIELHPGVARMVGIEPTEPRRIRAAALAVTDSVASHRSAAVIWRLVSPEDRSVVHLTGISANRDRGLRGVVCHRPRDRLDVRSVVWRGVPVTPPMRTLLDLGISDPHLVHEAVGRALESGMLTIPGLVAGLARHATKGRTGVVALRAAIDAWSIDARPTDSVLEQAFDALCGTHGLPPVVFHQIVEGWEVDFRFVGTPVIVEVDGWTTHGRQRHQFEVDRRKDDDLRAAGWIPARFTYRAIVERPSDTARRLRRLLDRWSAAPAPDAPAADAPADAG